MLLFHKNQTLKAPYRVLIRAIGLSILLRVYTLLICYPFNEFVNYWNGMCKTAPENTSLKNNYYHETLILINKEEFCIAKKTSPILWALAAPFISFDGERYLNIAKKELKYDFEHNGPFFPGLPYVINCSGKVFGFLYRIFISSDVPPEVICMAVGGLIVNNIILILASLILYYVVLNFESGRYKDIAEDAAFWFVLNPNSIHSNSLYTEPLFSLIVYLFTLILIKSESLKGIKIAEFTSIIFMAFSAFLRSNSIFILAPLFFYKLRRWKYFSSFIKFNFSRDMILNTIIHWGLALLEAIIVILPFILFQKNLYNDFCSSKNAVCQNMNLIRPWCEYLIPFSYSFIQKEYWNLSFLWFIKNSNTFSRFCYSLPVIIPAIELLYIKSKDIKLRFDIFKREDLGYSISFLITLITFILYAHTEVFMRQTLSHHIYFIHISLLFRRGILYSKIIKGFFILYFFIGATLFGLRIGWT